MTPLLFAQPEPHQAPGKKGSKEPQDHALGRSRGGLPTKIYMLCDANGDPLRFLLSGGQASDIAYAQPLLDEAYIPSLRSRPRKRCQWLLADKGYDAEPLLRSLSDATGDPAARHETQTQAGFGKTV
ncbi:hypothetical protein PSCICN_34110 [Pseudomonas cichorii]|nr:hypothetical protein PSCICN_34110 [Pseudomonas cichorii]